MRCEFDDGMKVSYSGPLRINKGNEINVYLSPNDIDTDIHGELHEAALHENCSELKHVAEEVIDIVGRNIHEE